MRLLAAQDVILSGTNEELSLFSKEFHAMKNRLAAKILIFATAIFVMVFALGYNLAAQGRPPVAGNGHMDLNSTLVDLDRVAQATQSDIANMQVEKWKSGWKSGFLKDGSHTGQAQQAAGSLQRNLRNALPGLIQDVQNSRGSISTTFKLYDDVSLVCEAVDSLISASETVGKKAEAAPLVDDYSALARIRRSLSAYIQQASASWETRGKAPYAAMSSPAAQPAQRQSAMAAASAASGPRVVNDNGVKKIIVDDTVPEKKAPAAATKKKPATTLTNLE
jgi:hypothetical protein